MREHSRLIRGALLAATLGLALSAVAASSSPAAQPSGSAAGRIIAGDVADPAAWPFAAAIYAKGRGFSRTKRFECTGSVIAPRVVLTAAHCTKSFANPIRNLKPADMAVVVGRSRLDDDSVGRRIAVTRVVPNPDYDSNHNRFDEGLLFLAEDAGVQPATLISPTQAPAATAVGTPVRSAGWGITSPFRPILPKALQTAAQTVVDPGRCKRIYDSVFSPQTSLCIFGAKVPHKRFIHVSACHGDSGGPLVADTPLGPRLVGTVLGGQDPCGILPAFYATVSSNLPFIESTAGVGPVDP